MRDGDVDAYVLFEEQRGRITVADDPIGAMRAQLADWWQATERHPHHESVLVALHRSSVAELNANAHTLMRNAGRLGDDEITVDERSFATGDRAVLLRNNKTLDVDNGDRGTIVDVDADRRALTVELDAGRQVRLPGWYLDAGLGRPRLCPDRPQAPEHHRRSHLRPGQRRPLPGGRLLDRHPRPPRNPLLPRLPTRPPDHEQAHGPPQPPEDAIARFARHLNDSRAQTLASDEPAHARARALTTTELREEHDRVGRRSATSPPAKHATLEVLADDAERQRTDLDETELRIGQTNHQLDTLGFFKRHGSEGDDLRGQLERLQSQHAYVDGLYSRTVQEIRKSAPTTTPSPGSTTTPTTSATSAPLEQELLVRDRRAERQLIAAAQIDPPDHITAVLGPRPENHATRPHGNAESPPSRPTATATTSPPTTSSAPSAPRRTAATPTPSSETPNAPSAKPGQSSASETTRSDPNEQQSRTESANPHRANAA